MKFIKLERFKLNPDNPRVIKDERFASLVQSIKDFPQMMVKRPMVCVTDTDGLFFPLGGNMRLKAIQEIGLKKVPEDWVMMADDWSEEQRKRFLIVDNVSFGEWDFENLASNWDSEQIKDWGLEMPDFKVEEPEAKEDNYEIPEEIKTDIVLGDLFEIGDHRLLCGDSTSKKDAERLMNKQKAEILFTSPPYSDMRNYNGDKDLSVSNIVEFIPTFKPHVNYQVINLGLQRKNNEVFAYWDDYIGKAKSIGYKFLSWNIWDRMAATSIANQSAMFAIYHEWVFVFGGELKKLNRTWDKSEESFKRSKSYKINEKGQKVKGSRQKDGSIKEISAGKEYESKNMGSVLSCYAEMERSIQHPAKFPVTFPSEYIKAMTNEREIIVESFTGSGTTMVAAHQLNRKCYGMELDPKYCQVIIDRMIKLDPTLEIRKNGEPYNGNNI